MNIFVELLFAFLDGKFSDWFQSAWNPGAFSNKKSS